MFFYVAIFIALGLLSFFVKRNATVLSLCATFLVIVAGLRGFYIGIDTHTYYYYFLSLAEGSSGYMEPLWNVLNIVVSLLHLNFNVFLLLVSAFTIYPVIYIFWKELDNPQFGLFLYYALYAYCNSFNGMRQYLAISIVFIAFYLLRHHKTLLSLLCIGIAANIHHSAFLGLLAFPLYYIRISRVVILCALLSSFLLGITVFPHLNFEWLYGKYATYTTSDTFIRDSLTQALLLAVLFNLVAIWLLFTTNKKLLQNLYIKLYFLGAILLNLTIQIALGSRIILYFTITQTVVFPLYLKQIHFPKIIQLAVYVVVLGYFTSIFFKILILGNFGQFSIFPYQMMWYPML